MTVRLETTYGVSVDGVFHDYMKLQDGHVQFQSKKRHSKLNCVLMMPVHRSEDVDGYRLTTRASPVRLLTT